jgi:hypothetical protein
MRTLLIFTAVLGVPLVALAQPTTDSKATEVSELVVRARKATELSGLNVPGACAIPSQDSDWPKAWFDAPMDPKDKRTEESPGTRAFILKLIADVRNGVPDYAHMGPQLRGEMSAKLKLTKLWIVCRGAFKDITFLHVSQKGYDDFEVDFSNGAIEWEAEPLDSHQVEQQTAVRFYYPQPATKQFVKLLASMLRQRPDYTLVSADIAPTLEARRQSFEASLKAWGPFNSIYFLRRSGDGSFVFRTVFKNRQVIWKLGPLDGAGRIADLTYDEGAT